LKLPVFARSLVPSASVGSTKVGRIKRRVTCAGVAVNPRDIVVGESDGVVVIPQGELLEAYRMH